MRLLLALPLLAFLTIHISVAEPIFKSLALKETSFNITFGNSSAKVLSQGITRRAVIDTINKKEGPNETISYQAYHLEFAFEQKFSNSKRYTIIEFYADDKLLHVVSLSDPSRKITTTRNQLNEVNYMAVNLEGVPLIMLNDATRINFER